eukprot:4857402-Lingulodinium_polyedra.AAC.1
MYVGRGFACRGGAGRALPARSRRGRSAGRLRRGCRRARNLRFRVRAQSNRLMQSFARWPAP